MKDSELVNIVRSEIDKNRYTSTLSSEREQATRYYLGEPFGNEVDGQSQIVSTDVQETVEWIMPSLMRIFTATDKAVSFDPEDPDDEKGAAQETDIVNHAFYKGNDGFLVLYTMMKDALLQKNGIVKFWWDDSEEKVREEYSQLNDQELMMLLDDENIEPIEHTGVPTQFGILHDVVVLRTNSTGRVVVEPVPPEEFLISTDTTSTNPSKARFVCHRTYKTRSELIAMGMRKSFVKNLPTETIGIEDEERLARDDLDELYEDSGHLGDWVRYEEAYVKVDYDGDGIDELRQVSVAGNKLCVFKDGSKGNWEVDAIPFASITPIIMTHKFYGMSVADTVMDLQLIKSTLLRGVLDNTYHANNPRTAVQDGEVNLDDLLTNRSGGVVRTEQRPQDVLMPRPVSPLPQQTFMVLEEMERIRKGRTGVGQDTMGLDSNVLAHGKTGVVDQSFDMARMRIELIARVFAETGIKQLFLGIHRLLQQNQNKKKWFKIRGEWVDVDPSEWRERSNMTVTVGLGTGNKDRQVQTLGTFYEIQKELGQMDPRFVQPENIYNTLERMVEAGGYKNVNEFFSDPTTQPPPQPQPDPQAELANAQAQALKTQAETTREEAVTNRMEIQWKHEENMTKIANEDAVKRTELEVRLIEAEKRENVPGSAI